MVVLRLIFDYCYSCKAAAERRWIDRPARLIGGLSYAPACPRNVREPLVPYRPAIAVVILLTRRSMFDDQNLRIKLTFRL